MRRISDKDADVGVSAYFNHTQRQQQEKRHEESKLEESLARL
jgi:hypothetical protein